MKKKGIILMALLISAFSLNALAQEPKTVTEFYLALPTEDFSFDSTTKKINGKADLIKHRKSVIQVEDINNGYLRLSGEMWEGWAEIAIFKKKGGGYVVGVTDVGCGPGCDGTVKFYTYEKGKWTNVTNHVFPKITEKMLVDALEERNLPADDTLPFFLLPRLGRTVKVATNYTNENGSDIDLTLLEFEWNGTEFVQK